MIEEIKQLMIYASREIDIDEKQQAETIYLLQTKLSNICNKLKQIYVNIELDRSLQEAEEKLHEEKKTARKKQLMKNLQEENLRKKRYYCSTCKFNGRDRNKLHIHFKTKKHIRLQRIQDLQCMVRGGS